MIVIILKLAPPTSDICRAKLRVLETTIRDESVCAKYGG